MVKNPPANARSRFDPWIGKIPWRMKWQPTPVFLPGKSMDREEPGGLQSMGSQRVRNDLATEQTCSSHSTTDNFSFFLPFFSSIEE